MFCVMKDSFNLRVYEFMSGICFYFYFYVIVMVFICDNFLLVEF